jgi:hypothetical protein
MATQQSRFATVVAKVGKPTVHLAWLAANKDAELRAAVAANRVMTVHQVMRGGRKDFGTVGWVKGPQTQVLIFPKSLRKFNGQRTRRESSRGTDAPAELNTRRRVRFG